VSHLSARFQLLPLRDASSERPALRAFLVVPSWAPGPRRVRLTVRPIRIAMWYNDTKQASSVMMS